MAGFAGLALYGDALQSLPLDDTRGSPREPILQPSSVALSVAVAAMAQYGGLPRDAELRGISAETRAGTSPDSAPPVIMAYTFTWQPRDDVNWGDRVIVSVATAVDRVCKGDGTLPKTSPPFATATCTSYDARYGLQPSWVRRVWRPWPLRRIAAAWTRWRAPPAPAPSSLTTACPRVDLTALRRVIGTALPPNIPLGMHRRISWEELLRTVRRPRDVVAHWSPPYPRLATFGDAEFADALFVDAGGFAAHLAHRPSPGSVDWFFFPSEVQDPVCPPRQAAKPRAWSPRPLAWETIVAILQEQAEDEATVRAGTRPGVASAVKTLDLSDPRRAAVGIETKLPGGDTWLATYHIDRTAPALLDARFVRTSLRH